MTNPPSYRKVNPADAPVLLIALTSPALALPELNDYAEHLISPSLSTLDGVALVQIFGQKRYAVRVRVLPDALSSRNISLDELTAALRAANVNTPVGTLDGARQTLTLQANRQLRNAQEFAELIVARATARRCGCATWRASRTASRPSRPTPTSTARPSITLAIQRQPDANTVKVVDAVRAALPGFRRSCRSRCDEPR